MDIQSAMNKIAELSEKKLNAQKTFLDRVITVSTGALALSVTFRTSIAGGNPGSIVLLKVAWIAFGIASVAGVIMHLAPASACKNLVKEMESNLNSRSAVPHWFFPVLWFAVLIAFPLGITCLVCFGVVNIH